MNQTFQVFDPKSYFSKFESEYDRSIDILHFLGHFSEYYDVEEINRIYDIINSSNKKYIVKNLQL
jgi:hypothetical protein